MVGPLQRSVNAIAKVRALCGTRGLVWGGLLATLALVLCFVPLLDLLGYDFSFAIGIAAGFAAVDLGHGTVAAARKASGPHDQPRSLATLVATGLACSLAVLVLPLLFSCLNALRVRNCSFAAGFAFFALLPVGTALFAAPVGTLAGVCFARRGRVVAWLVPIGSIVWTLFRLYVDPPVYAFDPFGGFFPGPIYDEALAPSQRLLLFRLTNLVWIGAALALVRLGSTRAGDPTPHGPVTAVPVFSFATLFRPRRRPTWRTLTLTGILLAAATVLFVERGSLGFHRTARDVEAWLRRTTRTPHFIIHSDPRDGQTAADLDLFHGDLEFRYAQLARTFGVEPGGPIVVYRFADSDSKKDLVGAATTLFAKPWRREIFVQVGGFPGHKLRHEIAHVFAAAFGDPLFGVALRWRLPLPSLASGLIEGVAEAADFSDPPSRSTVHQDARAIVDQGRAPPLAEVVGAGFSTHAGPVAYTLAASFCHYLLVSRGTEKLRAIYRSGGDFDNVYGGSLAALEHDWRAFLTRQPVDRMQRAAAAERFRRPAIFKTVCARDLATRVDRANDLRGHDPSRSIALLESVCADDPGEPHHQIALAHSLVAAGDTAGALARLDKLRGDAGLTQPIRLRAAVFAATILFHRKDFSEALRRIEQASALAVSDGDARTASAQARALADGDARDTLGRVLFGADAGRGLDPGLAIFLLTEFARRFPGEALGPYLIGRQLSHRDPKLALEHLSRACPVMIPGGVPPDAAPRPLDPLFMRECFRLTADAAFRTGGFVRAAATVRQLLPLLETEAERLQAQDLLERIDWARSPAQPPHSL